MKRLIPFFIIFPLLLSYSSIRAAPKKHKPEKEGSSQVSKKSRSEKSRAYGGDPSLKRGLELGYDDGVRAGKEEKRAGQKKSREYDLTRMAEKKYRMEYGSKSKFVSGYKSGFARGFKSGQLRERGESAKLSKRKEKYELKELRETKESKKGRFSERQENPKIASQRIKDKDTPPFSERSPQSEKLSSPPSRSVFPKSKPQQGVDVEADAL